MVERLADALAPGALAQRGHRTERTAAHLDGKCALEFSARQGGVRSGHDLPGRQVAVDLDRADAHGGLNAEARQHQPQCLRQGMRGFMSHARCGQAQGEVRAIEPAQEAASNLICVGAQGLRDGQQHAVDGGVAELAVQTRQIHHPQQHQPAFGGTVLTLQRAAQLDQEVVAIGQSCQRIAIGLSMQGGNLFGLRAGGHAQPINHRIHRSRESPQFRLAGLAHLPELAMLERSGLIDRRVERAADAANDQRGHAGGDQSHQRHGQRRAQAARPQGIVRIRHVAFHHHLTQRSPAV